jgi:hypothetical protein
MLVPNLVNGVPAIWRMMFKQIFQIPITLQPRGDNVKGFLIPDLPIVVRRGLE